MKVFKSNCNKRLGGIIAIMILGEHLFVCEERAMFEILRINSIQIGIRSVLGPLGSLVCN